MQWVIQWDYIASASSTPCNELTIQKLTKSSQIYQTSKKKNSVSMPKDYFSNDMAISALIYIKCKSTI